METRSALDATPNLSGWCYGRLRWVVVVGVALWVSVGLPLPLEGALPHELQLDVPPNLLILIDGGDSMVASPGELLANDQYLGGDEGQDFKSTILADCCSGSVTCSGDQPSLFYPQCSGIQPGPNQRTRLMMVQEALVGSISDDDFSCQYQCKSLYGDAAPAGDPNTLHHAYPVVVGEPPRADDGFLATHVDNIRFGFMTSESNPNPAITRPGHWSYGTKPSGHGINVGVRNDMAGNGALIRFSMDGLDTMVEVKEKVKQNVLSLIPYGRPSVAAMLADAYHFFKNDPSIRQRCVPGQACPADGVLPPLGDPYSRCRRSHVVLIASGQTNPEFDGGQQYQSAWWYADQLYQKGIPVKVIVVAPGYNPAGMDILNAIASAGGTDDAKVVHNVEDLRRSLNILGGTTSRTRSTTTYQTWSDQYAQLQVDASFTIPMDGGPWQGNLELLKYECEASDPDKVVDLARNLNVKNSGDRNIFTFIDDPNLNHSQKQVEFVLSEDKITPQLLGFSAAEVDRRNALIGVVRGESTSYKLGTIINSNPRVIGPPQLDLPFLSYTGGTVTLDQGDEEKVPGFQANAASRPTVAYVGANDGMLHAFVIGAHESDSELFGEELWGYIPGGLLNKLDLLSNPQGTYLNFVDGTPVVRDLRVERIADDLYGTDEWATVISGGLGLGGRLYYALNVTDPENPEVYWELTPDVLGRYLSDDIDARNLPCRNHANVEARIAACGEHLGWTFNTPALGNLVVDSPRGRREVAAAFLSGGRNMADKSQTGKVFVIAQIKPDLHPQTGKERIRILKVFHPGNTPGLGEFPITGNPVVFNDLPGTLVTRTFVGDEGGRLWRIDTSSINPALWSMQLFFDPYRMHPNRRRPIHGTPVLTTRFDGVVSVVYGSMSPRNIEDAGDHHMVASVMEILELSSLGVIETVRAGVNWFLPMKGMGQLTGDPVILNDVVYFPSFHAVRDDPCGPGQTRLWAVGLYGNFEAGGPKVVYDTFNYGKMWSDDDYLIRRYPSPKLSTSRDFLESNPPLCTDVEPSAGHAGHSLYCYFDDATIIFGLETTFRPSCIPDVASVIPDDWGYRTGTGGGILGKPAQAEMVIHTGVGGSTVRPESGGLPKASQMSLNLKLDQVRPLMWGVVYE